jgi:succinate-acetate transporter protein
MRVDTTIKKTFGEAKTAEQVFEYGVLFSKFALLFSLLVFSFISADISFISQNPRTFLAEAIAVGGLTAVSTAIIAKNRGATGGAMFNACFVAFLVFFIFHILMEMSGVNSDTSANPTSDDIRTQEKLHHPFFKYTAFSFVIITMTIMPILAFRVLDIKNFKCNKLNYFTEFISFGGLKFYTLLYDC